MIRQSSQFTTATQHVWFIDSAAGRHLLPGLMTGSVASGKRHKIRYHQASQGAAIADKKQPGLNLKSFLGLAGLMPGASQPGSVAVIRVDWAMYGWYADYLCACISRADQDENVLGTVLVIDCPGGVDQCAFKLYDTLKACQKPTLALCYYGMMNSAAYLMACGTSYVMASRSTDKIGGIGAYMHWMDSEKMWAAMGVVSKDIYAPESSRKNEEHRAAQTGDFSLIERLSSQSAQAFRAIVTAERGAKLKTSKKDDPLQGATYAAPDALRLGLIDEIGTLARAVAVIGQLAQGETVTSIVAVEDGIHPDDDDDETSLATAGNVPAPTTTSNPTEPSFATPNTPVSEPEPGALTDNQSLFAMTFGNQHPKLTALAGLDATAVTDEQLLEINAELDTRSIGAVRLVKATDIEAAVALQTELNTGKNTIVTLTSERDAARQELVTAQAEVVRLGALPGAEPTKVQKTEEPLTTSADSTQSLFFSEADEELKRLKAKASGK